MGQYLYLVYHTPKILKSRWSINNYVYFKNILTRKDWKISLRVLVFSEIFAFVEQFNSSKNIDHPSLSIEVTKLD